MLLTILLAAAYEKLFLRADAREALLAAAFATGLTATRHQSRVQ